jgi:hypothetical protein
MTEQNQTPDPLDSLPVTTGLENVISPDELSNIPVVPGSNTYDIINYSPTGDDGESYPLSSRCPMSWVAIIDEIRQDPSMPFMSVFKTRSDFVRWCIWQGISHANQFRIQLAEQDPNTPSPDPMVEAHMFAERTMGRLGARTALITKITKDVARLSEAVAIVTEAGEKAEAAALITYYIDGVHEQSDPFWRSFFTRQLFQHPSLAATIKEYIEVGLLTDAYLYEYALEFGLIEAAPEIPDVDEY